MTLLELLQKLDRLRELHNIKPERLTEKELDEIYILENLEIKMIIYEY